MEGKAEAQRSQGICPESHSWLVAELGREASVCSLSAYCPLSQRLPQMREGCVCYQQEQEA